MLILFIVNLRVVSIPAFLALVFLCRYIPLIMLFLVLGAISFLLNKFVVTVQKRQKRKEKKKQTYYSTQRCKMNPLHLQGLLSAWSLWMCSFPFIVFNVSNSGLIPSSVYPLHSSDWIWYYADFGTDPYIIIIILLFLAWIHCHSITMEFWFVIS